MDRAFFGLFQWSLIFFMTGGFVGLMLREFIRAAERAEIEADIARWPQDLTIDQLIRHLNAASPTQG